MAFLRKPRFPHRGGVDGRLPPDLLARLDAFGRFESDPQGSGVDASGHPNADYALLQVAKEDPDCFLAALASATDPIGGWTSYGAMRLAWHFGLLANDEPQADLDAIGYTALSFLRNRGTAWDHLAVAEKGLWNRVAAEPW
jgi:hypothetical protein